MKRTATFLVLAMAIGGTGVVTASTASAQVNCGAARTHAMRVYCYQRSMQIYRQQAQRYNNIARRQYRMHQNMGTALRRAPMIGRYAAPAWNAPRYYYNYRYGRP